MDPVLVSVNVQPMVSPTSRRPSRFTSVTVACLTSSRVELAWIGVTTVEGGAGTGVPVGSSAEAVAVLSTCPAFESASVIVYAVVAVHVVDAPGANVVAGQANAPALTSVMVTPCRVVEPVLVTTTV